MQLVIQEREETEVGLVAQDLPALLDQRDPGESLVSQELMAGLVLRDRQEILEVGDPPEVQVPMDKMELQDYGVSAVQMALPVEMEGLGELVSAVLL